MIGEDRHNHQFTFRNQKKRGSLKPGKGVRGEKNHNSKLTESDVIMIKSMFAYRTDSGIVRTLKEERGIVISAATIGRIRKGETWKHVQVQAASA